MEEQDKKALRSKIEEEIAATQKKIEVLKELTQPISPENAIGRVSRMDAINNKSINEAALRTTEEKMKKLHLAQQRTAEPDFGDCSRCKQPIPIGRLMLMPQSNLCVRCADR